MSLVPEIVVRMRQRRRAQREKNIRARFRSLSITLAALFSLGIAFGAISLALLYNRLTYDLPPTENLPILLHPTDGLLNQPSQILDRSGEHTLASLENPAAVNRRYLPLEKLPRHVQDAMVAAADPTFWEHPGYTSWDWRKTDTIAQKLVLDLLLWEEPPGARRGLRSRLLAAQIVRRYGREQVLEWYLNSAAYGHLAYGVDAAAWVYLGKSATGLTLAEAALLAAISQTPDLNPIDTPELALERRQSVLQTMLELGMISENQAQQALDEPLPPPPDSPPEESPFAAFVNLVLDELALQIPRQRLERGGFRILTTLDFDLQRQVDCAVRTQLQRLPGQKEAQPPETRDCETARLLPTLSLDPDAYPPGLAAEVVVIDPRSGQILALTGTRDDQTALPRVGGHAPGSLLAPYVYLAGFTRGFSPASLVWDIPANLPPGLDRNPNIDGEFHGPMRMRIALANDYLVPTLNLLNQFGAETVWKTTSQLGLTIETPAGKAAQRLLLEGGEVTLLEMAYAYGIFSNQGIQIGYAQPAAGNNNGNAPPLRPASILRLEDRNGQRWFDPGDPQGRPVIAPQLAYLITHILSDEPARWPSLGHPNPLEVGRPAAVKIGRTLDSQNAWTIGFTPNLIVGVWAGYDQQTPSAAVSPLFAASIWNAVLKYASQNLPAENWPTPPGISTLDVCDPSGLLPTIECPTVVKEVFAPGSEPTHLDTLYRKFQINRETGLLATVFTPPNLIEERVYMVPPPEAAEWAAQAGLPVPPEAYDLVSAPPAPLPGVQLNAPQMFAYISGEVPILGSAAGPGFVSYQVQIGPGLNPQQWIQIEQSTVPLENGQLAVWNTEGLSGLYAIRLLVLREDQQLDTAIIQVTVDNQPPQIDILYPAQDQQFTYPLDENVTIQVNANDDLALNTVEIYINNQLAAAFTQPPFAFSWQTVPGEHTLRVIASDLAGNSSETTLTFEVTR